MRGSVVLLLVEVGKEVGGTGGQGKAMREVARGGGWTEAGGHLCATF
jgi:hypothetical protein